MTATAPTVQEFRKAVLGWLPGLRIATGLVLFSFAATHFINHSLGLISIDALHAGQGLREAITRSLPGTIVLAASATIHFALGLVKSLSIRNWRIKPMDAVQLGFGLLIPLLLFRHILGTRGVRELFGIEDSYAYALWAMWPAEALNQALLVMLVWVHGCIGIHRWLMLRDWYRRLLWLWYGLALLIPALAFAGFVAAGRNAALVQSFENPFQVGQYDQLAEAFAMTTKGYSIVLAGALLSWAALFVASRYRRKVAVSYTNGPTVLAPAGLTLLEISRLNRIAHASVCGGRARCSTCRVRVVDGLDKQPAALENELKVLRRVGAPANVRLACQLRPSAALKITTLLPANVDAMDGSHPDKYLWGVEQDVTIVFSDLRGFTRLSEGRLSYDVVFLLNQFLGRMGEAIEDSGGYVDKFMGDGIMAIFGMDEPVQVGATKALAAARAMGGVLESLNLTLREELPQKLEIGIGIHTGLAILGRIGAASNMEAARRITALGDTVNTASRLEGMTKELGVQAVISKRTIEAAGLPELGELMPRVVEIRGLSEPFEILTAKRASEIPDRRA